MYSWNRCVTQTAGLIAACMITAGIATALEDTDAGAGTDIVSTDPAHMYDFKLGHWNISWRNKTNGGTFEFTSVSHVFLALDGTALIDEQRSDLFKGMTYRTFNPYNREWVVRWLPAVLPPFDNPISASLEDGVPVERHHQIANSQFQGDNREVMVVTRFTDITKDGFKFRQDWSFDEGKTWKKDVLYYEATRVSSGKKN